MDPQPYVERILDDESLAGDLDEPERTRLVEWLVAQVEAAVRAAKSDADADAAVAALRKQGRAAAADPAEFARLLTPAPRRDPR